MFRRNLFDISLFVFIEAQKQLIPGLSYDECGRAFMHYFRITEDELPLRTILQTHLRIRKDITEDEKTKEA